MKSLEYSFYCFMLVWSISGFIAFVKSGKGHPLRHFLLGGPIVWVCVIAIMPFVALYLGLSKLMNNDL